jgi:hypothetical protein
MIAATTYFQEATKIFIAFKKVYFPVSKITNGKANFGINEQSY